MSFCYQSFSILFRPPPIFFFFGSVNLDLFFIHLILNLLTFLNFQDQLTVFNCRGLLRTSDMRLFSQTNGSGDQLQILKIPASIAAHTPFYASKCQVHPGYAVRLFGLTNTSSRKHTSLKVLGFNFGNATYLTT